MNWALQFYVWERVCHCSLIKPPYGAAVGQEEPITMLWSLAEIPKPETESVILSLCLRCEHGIGFRPADAFAAWQMLCVVYASRLPM